MYQPRRRHFSGNHSLRHRLAHSLPFYYGWVIFSIGALASYSSRPLMAVATLSVFAVPMTREFGWSYALLRRGQPGRTVRHRSVALCGSAHRPLRLRGNPGAYLGHRRRLRLRPVANRPGLGPSTGCTSRGGWPLPAPWSWAPPPLSTTGSSAAVPLPWPC